MNREMLASHPNVEGVNAQNNYIKCTTTNEHIISYYDLHFGSGAIHDWVGEFMHATTKNGSQPLQNPDYHRLVAIANNQGAQFGFDSMEGQMFYEGQYSSFDPRRELALAVYLAGLNLEAFEQKNTLSEMFEQHSVDAAVGVWGMSFEIRKGKLAETVSKTVFDSMWFVRATRRAHARRKVLVPHTELNAKLAGLEFTVFDAEEMDDHTFEVDVLPRVQATLGDYFNPEVAFSTFQKAPLRFYSYGKSLILSDALNQRRSQE